ncbi:MAG TPA: hypothetical protein VFB79_21605 [Candidatus Angelobacter sp.]|nr:hypothetical protein [Candidatus Angelobacter sp.]
MKQPKELSFDWHDVFQRLFFGGGVGASATVVLELVHAEPKMFLETFQRWGAAAFITLIVLFMVNSGFRSLIRASADNAAALQRLADSVQMIAQKDTEESYEQKILLGHIGSSIEKLRESMAELSDRLPPARLSQGAGK